METKAGNDNKPDEIDKVFESMFSDVESRPQPPAEIEREIFLHVEKQLEIQREVIKRRKRFTYFAMAASVLLVLLIQPLFFRSSEPTDQGSAVGSVVKFFGEVTVTGKERQISLERGGQKTPLFAGQLLNTASNAGLSFQLGSSQNQVRADQDTELRLLSDCRLDLVSGRLYIDTQPRPPASQNCALQIDTQFGTVKHIGTQFIVASSNEAVQVLVREGRVEVNDGNQIHTVSYGQKGNLDASGIFRSELIQSHGTLWTWIEQLAPGYDIEGRSLNDFLEWFCRETGKKMTFESVEARTVAKGTVLHGKHLDMEPMLALDLILQTNDLSWEEQDGTIHIFLER